MTLFQFHFQSSIIFTFTFYNADDLVLHLELYLMLVLLCLLLLLFFLQDLLDQKCKVKINIYLESFIWQHILNFLSFYIYGHMF